MFNRDCIASKLVRPQASADTEPGKRKVFSQVPADKPARALFRALLALSADLADAGARLDCGKRRAIVLECTDENRVVEWPSSPGLCVTNLGCECQSRKAFSRFGLLVRTVGGSTTGAPPRMSCSAIGNEFYCKANRCHWQKWSLTCR